MARAFVLLWAIFFVAAVLYLMEDVFREFNGSRKARAKRREERRAAEVQRQIDAEVARQRGKGPARTVKQDGEVWRVIGKDGEEEFGPTYSEQLARAVAEELDKVDPLPVPPKKFSEDPKRQVPAKHRTKPKPKALPPAQPEWEHAAYYAELQRNVGQAWDVLYSLRWSLDSREMAKVVRDYEKALWQSAEVRCKYCGMELLNHGSEKVKSFESAKPINVICFNTRTGERYKTNMSLKLWEEDEWK